MTTVSQIMSTEMQSVGPEESLQRAAQMMRSLDVEALPVCAGGVLLGMVSDRDLAVRGTAAGLVPTEACVSDVMVRARWFCSADLDVEQLRRVMGESRHRRMPVVDIGHRLLGMVSVADLGPAP